MRFANRRTFTAQKIDVAHYEFRGGASESNGFALRDSVLDCGSHLPLSPFCTLPGHPLSHILCISRFPWLQLRLHSLFPHSHLRSGVSAERRTLHSSAASFELARQTHSVTLNP